MRNSIYSPRESGYFPAGAEFDPSAPYNIKDPPEKTFDIAVSCSLSKDTEVTSDNYEDDEFSSTLNEPWNTYVDSEDTIDQIIDFARQCAELMLTKHDYSIKSKWGLRKMIDSCKGWIVDEENAEQQ